MPTTKEKLLGKDAGKMDNPEIAGLRKNGDKNAKQWKKRWEGRFIIDKAKIQRNTKEYKGDEATEM